MENKRKVFPDFKEAFLMMDECEDYFDDPGLSADEKKWAKNLFIICESIAQQHKKHFQTEKINHLPILKQLSKKQAS